MEGTQVLQHSPKAADLKQTVSPAAWVDFYLPWVFVAELRAKY